VHECLEKGSKKIRFTANIRSISGVRPLARISCTL